ncbi:sec-independent translocase [Streptomyces reniochalinae]|uniref:Sec-independent protein translocase protein TatB n=1 Tax=Streptomyces reniochalinae TaxID=2250578 RepID=A0A367EWW1_9ACTN|nr:sec-independent translocase [Streptomyces reniochalinae]RCG22614.1 Sec-independent protein translocase TatB [Streptomyces reniochalinae]
MFFDIGPLELVTLIVLAVLVFGPEKLPKVIQDVAAFIRKVRQFSDSAKEDIREELGPEFKDFEFEDLNPKTFARKHLLENEDLGLKEISNSFDFRKDLDEVTDAVNGGGAADGPGSNGSSAGKNGSGAIDMVKKGASSPSRGTPDLAKHGSDGVNGRPVGGDGPRRGDPPPFDADAT